MTKLDRALSAFKWSVAGFVFVVCSNVVFVTGGMKLSPFSVALLVVSLTCGAVAAVKASRA